jgi:hypothetical protein
MLECSKIEMMRCINFAIDSKDHYIISRLLLHESTNNADVKKILEDEIFTYLNKHYKDKVDREILKEALVASKKSLKENYYE